MASTEACLIADGGSTKCSWALVRGGSTLRFETQGVNPALVSADDIERIWRTERTDWRQLADCSIAYYGAGCIGGKANDAIATALRRLTQSDKTISVCSDMVGAARATLGDTQGIVCILGTGSNSCLYDGRQLTANVRPLGYILGDEGSGADIGKHIVADALKGLLSEETTKSFWDFAKADYPTLIEKIYRQPNANVFLASFAPFAATNIGNEEVRNIVEGRFRAFFERNVFQYPKADIEKGVAFVGSVAYAFKAVLESVASGCGVRIKTIVRSPIDGLIDYHRALKA